MQEKEHPKFSNGKVTQLWECKGGDYYHTLTGARSMVTPTLFSGGILADDMGLGKTLEMISLILDEPAGRPTLIVAPLGVMTNWEFELAKHVLPSTPVQYLRYHGEGCEVPVEELQGFEVVITSYSILSRESSKSHKLQQIEWRRIILDEGHVIRNANTQAAKAACSLKAQSTWACTGTPM